MKPYMPPRRLTEDPLDGTHPPKSSRNANRSHKKGARQREDEETARTLMRECGDERDFY